MYDIRTLKVKIAYGLFRPTDEELRVQNVDPSHSQVNQVKKSKQTNISPMTIKQTLKYSYFSLVHLIQIYCPISHFYYDFQGC